MTTVDADQPVPFTPPPYPYDRLDRFRPAAAAHAGGVIDLSVGTPVDSPTPAVVAALADASAARTYPPSIGTPAFREAAAAWVERRLGARVDPATEVGATVGSKELVTGLPHWLRRREPGRDTVLYPSVAYPSYEMGAVLAGCRAVPVPVDDSFRLDVGAIDEADAERALCLWSNTPGNPAGALDDLGAVAAWGRARGVPVFSDECYAAFTWDGAPRTILTSGTDGVVAVHSLSKRSNLAGARIGFYAGDAGLVHYLREIRKHAGAMAPGPAQAAAVVALGDDADEEHQRERYRERLDLLRRVWRDGLGVDVPMPGGAFYLFPRAPGGDAWGLVERLAREAGTLVSPGEFYGPAAAAHVRVAAVAPLERLSLLADRLGC